MAKSKNMEYHLHFSKTCMAYCQIYLIFIQISSIIFGDKYFHPENSNENYKLVLVYLVAFTARISLQFATIINSQNLIRYESEMRNINNIFSNIFSKFKYYVIYYYPFVFHHQIYIRKTIPKILFYPDQIEECKKALPYKILFVSNLSPFTVRFKILELFTYEKIKLYKIN